MSDAINVPKSPSEYASLDAAFAHQRTPLANQALVRRLLAGVEVKQYLDGKSHIKVTRVSGGPAIQVHFGYSNGFISEDEIIRNAGDVDRWPSGRGTGMWGVSHPENRLRSGAGKRERRNREHGTCPDCGLQLPASGTCGTCD